MTSKIRAYFLEPHFHFNRIQFNLITLVLVSIGFATGSYFTLRGIVSIFAATSPWTQTSWVGGDSPSLATGTVTTWSALSGTEATASAGRISLVATSGWSASYAEWLYRQNISISNSGSTLTNYQIPVIVNTQTLISAGKLQSSCQDLRFASSSGTALPYWVEIGCNSTSTTVWVKVSSVASGSSTIYMYYGSSGAAAGSSGTNTFTFFDTFDSFNTSTWTTTGTQVVTSSEITVSTGAVYSNAAAGTQPNTIVEAKVKWNTVTGSYSGLAISGDQTISGGNSGSDKLAMLITNPGSTTILSYGADGSSASYNINSGSSQFTTSVGTSQIIGMAVTGSQEIFYKDRAITNSYSGAWTGNYFISLGFFTGSAAGATDIEDIAIDWILARQYTVSAPTVGSPSTEETSYTASGSLTSTVFDAGFAADWGTLTYTASASGVTVKVRTSSNSDMSGATAWGSCSGIATSTDLSASGCVTDQHRYLQYQVTLAIQGALSPEFYDISIPFTASDQVKPDVNATAVAITGVTSGAWSKNEPTITWTAGSDNAGGIGLAGYCVSLDEATIGVSSSLDPETSAGKLNGIDDGVTNKDTCGYIATGTSLNLASVAGLTLTSNKQYYFSIKAVDSAGNVYTGTSGNYQDLVSFKYDDTAPTNVTYITAPSGNLSNVTDMFFGWPTTGVGVATDSASQVLGWQYQINSSSGTWHGTTVDSALGLDYIPATASAYYLVASRDEGAIVNGSNIIYFRTVDNAGNLSSASTYRTASLSYCGAAQSFTSSCDATDSVTVTPSSSDTNSFALSWPTASPSGSNTVGSYYYMINTSPPTSLTTLQGNSSTYIDNDLVRTVATAALPNVNKGANTLYVVAIDDATTPNYSSSNCIKGVFTLNSTDPDNVGNVVASDSSIKASEQWNVTLTWTAPTYQGAGNLTYLVKRSTDNSTFTQVGTTTGLSYVDSTPTSSIYYYKVYTQDGADALSSGTNAVSITPTGKWTSAPSLDTQPSASSITTKKATITWGTSRSSDSKIQYGTTSGSYGSDEVSNSSQVSSHTVNLTNLKAGTTYYYKAKWTDEDGNTGTSEEKSFTTAAAPNIKEAKATSISLSSAIIQFTSTAASSAKIYYGISTAFGGTTTTSTGTGESTYNVLLSDLNDGTKYYYKINTFDSDGNEYEGNVYSFETLPRPKISSVRIQQVANTAQSTLLITWTTNTEVSSVVSFYPSGRPAEIRDEVNVALTKGEHRMIIRSLLPQTDYVLVVKGRDKAGNEATSDTQRVTTATDTRPPQVSDLRVEGTNVQTSSSSTQQESTAQLLVSWNTDEPATSQVEFGEGTGANYAQKTQEDANLTLNHLVIISSLTPSKVYHLRSLSRDKVGNLGNSIDTVTITPKATENAFNLVVTNLREAFGFLGGM